MNHYTLGLLSVYSIPAKHQDCLHLRRWSCFVNKDTRYGMRNLGNICTHPNTEYPLIHTKQYRWWKGFSKTSRENKR